MFEKFDRTIVPPYATLQHLIFIFWVYGYNKSIINGISEYSNENVYYD